MLIQIVTVCLGDACKICILIARKCKKNVLTSKNGNRPPPSKNWGTNLWAPYNYASDRCMYGLSAASNCLTVIRPTSSTAWCHQQVLSFNMQGSNDSFLKLIDWFLLERITENGKATYICHNIRHTMHYDISVKGKTLGNLAGWRLFVSLCLPMLMWWNSVRWKSMSPCYFIIMVGTKNSDIRG